ncbi:DegT/DnrJ/EryC1/StrS family aminotransferase [Salinigranum halophilum]|uniref:DegT/DnrJ/EryC1/StrS family aminotransferase n=1 Tax=Salinigranum halophilum TaxID=2565931 RepID=UPI00115D079B|nr:DegT/DnrJ/EryC1/StrS family aminotransferase [Salinigranum halophilum]
MTIPIANPQVGDAEREYVEAVLDSGQLADGPEVRRFESEFAAYCDTDDAVATSNGTTALHAALHALGIGEGDRVVTTPFTYIATANAVSFCDATVEFVDIDPETYNIDPAALERRLREGPPVDAVVAVHLYGLPADMERLAELAGAYDFALVEDAAQAHGATVDGDRVGSLADAGCFSFYPTKNMTTGEGGMITTDRSDVADRAARFVDHGRSEGYEHAEIGHNFRMTSVAAALGRAQLQRLPRFTSARQLNASRLSTALERTAVRTPSVPDNRTHVYHQYTIRTTDREALCSRLDEQDVGYGVYYPVPVHEQAAYDHVDAVAPNAEQAAEEVLSLPVHPALTRADVEQVATAVRESMEVIA